MIITADTVRTPEQCWQPGWVRVAGAWITGCGPGSPPAGPPPAGPVPVHLPGTVVPGFVDAHAHGGGGFDYTSGDQEVAAAAAAAHVARGVTSPVASLVTAPPVQLERAVAALAELVSAGVLAGLHLEGPWLSASRAGAHEPAYLRSPRPDEVERLLAAGRGTIRMVTLAPELDGAEAAIRRITGHGAVAAIGHTAAGYDLTRTAIEAGARAGTHLYNAMPPVHHREPGAAGALLDDERCRVELIADGQHLHPATLRHAVRLAGPGRYLLVSDATAGAATPGRGAADGNYRLGEQELLVTAGRARLAGTGALAGSTCALDAALGHLKAVTPVPFGQDLAAATRTPAEMLGLVRAGALAPGRRADLVALGPDGAPTAILRAGSWVRPAG